MAVHRLHQGRPVPDVPPGIDIGLRGEQRLHHLQMPIATAAINAVVW
jgi:hypothetical protein